MSYDVSLTIDTGAPEATVVYSRNHTSNTAQMWREAGCDIAAFDGMPAPEFAASLGPAIEKMKAEPDRFRAYEPGNGWGSFETTIEFLTELLIACGTHPKTTVEVSR